MKLMKLSVLGQASLVFTHNFSDCSMSSALLQAEIVKHRPVLVFGRRRSDRLTKGALPSAAALIITDHTKVNIFA